MDGMHVNKEADRAKMQSNQPSEILDFLTSQISEAVILTDANGKILWASPRTRRIFHRRQIKWEGNSLETFCRPVHGSWEKFCHRAAKGMFSRRNVLFQCSKNTSIFLDILAKPLSNKEGRLDLLWIVRDQTTENERETALLAKEKNVEEFVYTVSHDLKAPLVSIEGYLSLLREDNWNHLNEEGKYFIEKISKNVHVMRRMIQDLLELSRISQETPSQKLLSVGKIIQEVLEEFRFQIEKKQIQLILQSPFPRIQGNPQHIRLLFSNLISNAIKFLGDQPEPRIEIGWEKGNATIHYFVRDNGMGISPRYHDQIFNLFYRPKNSGEKEGSGVGLAIVKKIAKEHGGTVRVASEEGQGATFFVSFPQPKRT